MDYKNASTKFLGWVVASYSFGQLIASPVLGVWADHRPTREPLIVATLFNIVFNVVYSYCGAFGGGVAGWMMILSRTLVGFGAGLASLGHRFKLYCSMSTVESPNKESPSSPPPNMGAIVTMSIRITSIRITQQYDGILLVVSL